MPRTKRFAEAKKKVKVNQTYSLVDAIKLARETSTVKFDSSIELHARLGIDPKKGEQQIRTTVSLPHTSGTAKKIAAFVPEGLEQTAKDAGADIVGGEQLIEKISKSQKIEFDIAVATPDMMAKIAKIAKILGPKGLMPNPKTDTVGTDVVKMITELKKGKLAFKNDNTGNVHIVIGKVSLTEEQLLENAEAILETIRRSKPPSSKGIYVRSLHLASSMGPSIAITL